MPSNYLNKIQRFTEDPVFSLKRKFVNTFPNIAPDKWFLQVKFYKCMGYKLDLKNPKTFNEKLQWLKLYDRNPLYTTLVDKYRVKQYVAEKIGEEYVIPTLAVYKSIDEIDLDKLPDQFVLKCNHDSGSIVICKDKNSFDLASAKERLNRALKYNYYYNSREWPYKNVNRCILAEQYISEGSGRELHDYKFYCFNGKVEYFGYSIGEASHNVQNLKYNRQLENIDYLFKKQSTLDMDTVSLPINIREMISIADKLATSVPSPHVRIDMYNIKEKIYVGEITLYSSGGWIRICNDNYQQFLANLIHIGK